MKITSDSQLLASGNRLVQHAFQLSQNHDDYQLGFSVQLSTGPYASSTTISKLFQTELDVLQVRDFN